jgi:shikimate kinase
MTAQRHIRNLALIGFMGTGKSSVGRFVATQLHFDFIDTDDLIEMHAGKPITEIFSHEGEPRFRQIEEQIVSELARRQRTVIATGGGLGANAVNLVSLKEHALVVCLWASPTSIWQRVQHQSHRPLLQNTDPMAKIRTLLTEREAIYKQADVLVNTEMRSIRQVGQHVLHEFYSARCGPAAP